MRPQARRLFRGIGKGRRFGVEMRRLCEFHLDGVHAVLRPAVVACRPAALEATVDDMAVTTCCGTDIARRSFDLRSAALAVVGADVEVGQPALEQERTVRTDRVTVVEDGDAVL